MDDSFERKAREWVRGNYDRRGMTEDNEVAKLVALLREVHNEALVKACDQFDGWLCLDHGGSEEESIKNRIWEQRAALAARSTGGSKT